MADIGGKPLAEASVKLSVEGAEQVAQSLKAVSEQAKVTAADVASVGQEAGDIKAEQSSGELAAAAQRELSEAFNERARATQSAINAAELDAQRLAGVNLEASRLAEGIRELAAAEAAISTERGILSMTDRINGLNVSIRSVTGGALRLVSTITRLGVVAGAAVGGVIALAVGLKRLSDEATGTELRKGFRDAQDYIDQTGITVNRLNVTLDQARAELAALSDRMTELGKKRGVFDDRVVGQLQRLAPVFREIQREITALENQAKARAVNDARLLEAEGRIATQKEAQARLDAESLEMLSEEERIERRIAQIRIDAAHIGSMEADEAAKKIIHSIREAQAEKKRADQEASEARIRDIVNESKAAIEADRKRQREMEERSIESQRRIFQAGRDMATNDIRSIAVSNQQANTLLRIIAESSQGGVWRS